MMMVRNRGGGGDSSSSGTRRMISSFPRYDGGNLVATILSVYDIPDEYGPVRSVTMTVMNSHVVETGPPSGRHREHNSFKFSNPSNHPPNSTTTNIINRHSNHNDNHNNYNNRNNNHNSISLRGGTNGKEKNGTTAEMTTTTTTNQLSVLAPLESLHPLTVTFRVICDPPPTTHDTDTSNDDLPEWMIA